MYPFAEADAAGVPKAPHTLSEAEIDEISKLDRGWAGRGCFGGPRVERGGKSEPRDLQHTDYPWRADGSERA